MARIKFALKVMKARFSADRKRCPYCESCLHQKLQRKWLLIEARKCAFCSLIFRYPTDSVGDAFSFYDKTYQGKQATHLPDNELMSRLTATNFAASPFDKSNRVQFIQSICPSGRILDF